MKHPPVRVITVQVLGLSSSTHGTKAGIQHTSENTEHKDTHLSNRYSVSRRISRTSHNLQITKFRFKIQGQSVCRLKFDLRGLICVGWTCTRTTLNDHLVESVVDYSRPDNFNPAWVNVSTEQWNVLLLSQGLINILAECTEDWVDYALISFKNEFP